MVELYDSKLVSKLKTTVIGSHFSVLESKIHELEEFMGKLKEIMGFVVQDDVTNFLNNQIKIIDIDISKRDIAVGNPPKKKEFAEGLFDSAMDIRFLGIFCSRLNEAINKAAVDSQPIVKKMFREKEITIRFK